MVSFMNKLKEFMYINYKVDITHIRCAAHILNLVAGVLYDSSEMKDAICSIREAIKAIRGSSKLELKLEQYAKLNEEADRKLILDCQIRWNSTFDMLQVALKLKNSLTQLSSNESSMRDIEEDEWNKVKLVISILQPFEIATEEICGDNYVVVSKLYPVFTSIKNHLNDCSKKNHYSLYKSVIENMLMENSQ